MTTYAERKHLAAVAELPCCVCELYGVENRGVEVHHIRTGIGMGRRASHYETIPLCVTHHRHGKDGIHGAGRKAFERIHGVTELELLEATRMKLGGAT